MNFLKSRWISVVIIAGIGWLGLSFIKIKLQEDIVNKEVEEIEAKIYNLEESNNSIEKLISYFKNPLFLEKEARTKLNLKASGEEVVFVYSDTDGEPSSSSVDFQKQLAQMPSYLKWFYYLLGH